MLTIINTRTIIDTYSELTAPMAQKVGEMKEQIKRYRSRKAFLAAWDKIEKSDNCIMRNFAGDPLNWACFAKLKHKNKIFGAKPVGDKLTIEFYLIND